MPRILVVDDEEVCRIVLAKSLETVGEVVTAVDGQKAVDAVRTAIVKGMPFELICLDIMMPVMDGQATLREIRLIEQAAETPEGKEAKVIMTTALNDPVNLMEAIPRCDAYLTKPIDRGDLMFYVRKFGLIGAADRSAQRRPVSGDAR
ncbi:MAG TPA: response regulator [Bacteroidota bacterium]|nr:response regulator [Bacteroidota bacterium]